MPKTTMPNTTVYVVDQGEETEEQKTIFTKLNEQSIAIDCSNDIHEYLNTAMDGEIAVYHNGICHILDKYKALGQIEASSEVEPQTEGMDWALGIDFADGSALLLELGRNGAVTTNVGYVEFLDKKQLN